MPLSTGPRNLITDVEGIKVGNAADAAIKSGVTALVCDAPTVVAVQVLGGAPGTRDTDLLHRVLIELRSFDNLLAFRFG